MTSQVWFVVKAVLRLFSPSRDRTIEFEPNRPHVLQFSPNRNHVMVFDGQGPTS